MKLGKIEVKRYESRNLRSMSVLINGCRCWQLGDEGRWRKKEGRSPVLISPTGVTFVRDLCRNKISQRMNKKSHECGNRLRNTSVSVTYWELVDKQSLEHQISHPNESYNTYTLQADKVTL